MSSRLPWLDIQHYPGAAVNGDTSGDFQNTENCIHTRRGDTTPWWEVDLGRPYPVYRISVWARTYFIIRMKGCTITVDGQECYRFSEAPATRHTNLTCTSGVLNGSVVRVSKNTGQFSGDNTTINICEVQVFICSDGYWGSGCDRRCGNCSNSEVCDKVTGHCSSCPPGLQPPLCYTDCRNGTFGPNCTQTCSEVCADVCDKVSGHCTCKPGWLGPACYSDEQTGDEYSVLGIVAGAAVGTACAEALLVIGVFLVVRWMRRRSSRGDTAQRAANDDGKGTSRSQESPTADDRNLLTPPFIELHSIHGASGGQPNVGNANCEQGMPSAVSSPAVSFPVTAGEANAVAGGSSDEPPFVSSAPSTDQPYEILDSQRETTYDRPQMYQNTLEHHVYNDLKN